MTKEHFEKSKEELTDIKTSWLQALRFLHYFKHLAEKSTPYKILNNLRFYLGYNGYTTKQYAEVSLWHSRSVRFDKLRASLDDVYTCGFISDSEMELFSDLIYTTHKLIKKHILIYLFL